jgi:hypothetical protein
MRTKPLDGEAPSEMASTGCAGPREGILTRSMNRFELSMDFDPP